ncbi:MAG TPA: transglutaminase-like domain-containing protein [Desulfosporosinus sp.]
MDLILETNNLEDYLKSSEIIDYDNETIKEIARQLSEEIEDEVETIRTAYNFVRDNVHHSADINGQIVTCKASEVLREKQGICYAKSHLLAAILRSLGIPTGFCYQKLILDDEIKPWIILHGLNAIYIKSLRKWIRVDARGNKDGVSAEFSLNVEKLAFPVRKEFGEKDEPVIYVNPNINVVQVLIDSKTIEELFENLPTEL